MFVMAKNDKKPSKSEVANEPITGARDVLEAAGCKNLVVGGTTPCGSSFLLTQPTTPQLRGMMREVIAKHAAERRGR
jgi:hypothetical protein